MLLKSARADTAMSALRLPSHGSRRNPASSGPTMAPHTFSA